MRFYQYLPALEAAGLEVTVLPLMSDAYVAQLQRGQRTASEVWHAYARRTAALQRSVGADVLWIEKDALPWVPGIVELALLRTRTPLVLDYDDAVFHQYDQHRWGAVKWLLGRKHASLMQRAALVMTGNQYIADYARAAGARSVEVVPTVVDLERYHLPTSDSVDSARPTIGWIGQRATASFLRPLSPVFKEMADKGLARFAAIGIDAAALALPMTPVPWSEDTEVDSIRRLDIGIMPLEDGPFERGKCGYKLIQYMACGLPVVASPVGVNRQIVDHGVNGFLASNLQEWDEALRMLAADRDLRQRMGIAGRQKVERQFSLQVTGARVAELLRRVAASQ